jgi:regulator of sirC expression with transglutaminase-like and TPR domain
MDPRHEGARRQAREELRRLLDEAPEPFPLDRAALLLAVDEYPLLDRSGCEVRLDRYAERMHQTDPEPRRRLGRLRQVLFEEESFHGNREQYYDVRNSYLNEVLDRKLGIPISLAAVVLGVARRLGWPMEGVNFPNHFLVGYFTPRETLAIDPFHGGLILGDDELKERWRLATGEDAPPPGEMLPPAPARSILVRMLNNIRVIHVQGRRYRLAAVATEKIALIEPESPGHERDLGYLFLAARESARAVHHLERYLARVGDAADAARVGEALQRAQDSLGDAG